MTTSGGVVGYTAGVFDLFHVGHLNLLARAKQLCDHLIVGVSTDELCAGSKHKQPVVPYPERVQIVAAIRHVDQVVPQTTLDKFAAWERYQYDVLFVGSDWQGHPRWVEYEERLRGVGSRVVYLPYTAHTSSTLLRRALQIHVSNLQEAVPGTGVA